MKQTTTTRYETSRFARFFTEWTRVGRDVLFSDWTERMRRLLTLLGLVGHVILAAAMVRGEAALSVRRLAERKLLKLISAHTYAVTRPHIPTDGPI